MREVEVCKFHHPRSDGALGCGQVSCEVVDAEICSSAAGEVEFVIAVVVVVAEDDVAVSETGGVVGELECCRCRGWSGGGNDWWECH